MDNEILDRIPDQEGPVSKIPDGKIPLGLCKQACLHSEAAMTCIYEAMEDPDLSDAQRMLFASIVDVFGQASTAILNVIKDEMDEEEFLNEHIDIDDVGLFPGDEEMDPLDIPIG